MTVGEFIAILAELPPTTTISFEDGIGVLDPLGGEPRLSFAEDGLVVVPTPALTTSHRSAQRARESGWAW